MHHIPFRLVRSTASELRSKVSAFVIVTSCAGLGSALVACGDGAADGSGGAAGDTGGAATDGGSGGAGSAVGSGGAAPTGGTSQTGGAAQTGGETGSETGGSGSSSAGGTDAGGGSGGGSGSDDPELPDLNGKTEASCKVTIASSDLSAQIGTVGIVEFTSDLAGQTDAVIEFGETTAYGLVAPVDLTGSNRTLLLGMTTTTEYHYRVLVIAGDAYCYGPDQTITTGPLPAGGPSHLTAEPGSSSAPKTPGFFLTSDFNGEWIYIFDQDGRIVWFYRSPFGQTSRALMSWNGKKMYARQLNVGRAESGPFLEVGMDGSSPLEVNLPTSHHDFTVTEDGIVYIKKAPSSTCDSLYRHTDGAADDGGDALLFDVEEAFPSGGGGGGIGGESCHTNSVHYNVRDGSVTASDLNHNAYFKVSAAGELEWVLGSADSSFTGDGAEWDRQHGHHLFEADTLLFFNNGPMQGGDTIVREVTLDTNASTATYNAFSYASEYGSGTMGDVQRLPSGNTIVTYSNDGVVQEVGPDGEPVQTFSLSTSSGYGNHRPSLYGAPPE